MNNNTDKEGVKQPFWRTTTFYIRLVILFIIFSFFAPIIFSKLSIGIDFTKTGNIGDTIGGIMNPFVAIAGVIVTYLAFKMQFDANKSLKKQLNDQKKEFSKQQIETQFYEMLRLHKENVNELSIEMYEKAAMFDGFLVKYSGAEIKGRKVFYSFVKEVEYIYSMIEKNRSSNDQIIVFGGEVNINSLREAYNIFFQGFNFSKINEITSINSEEDKKMPRRFDDKINYDLAEGQSYQLGHYFRHLFQTVKFIANKPEKLLSYEEKRNYLRILRSQLSNNEQVLLLYNYIGRFGENWENDENRFFSDYRMIHNLYDEMIIYGFKLKDFFKKTLEEDKYKKEKNEDGVERKNDLMFNFQNERV